MYNMKKVLFLFLFSITLLAQEKNENSFSFKLIGHVKTDVMLDSRQTVSARQGHFLLYPAAENLDINGSDINAAPNFNMLSIQTRLTGIITGPEAFGAKSSGVIEGSFFGSVNPDINGFRLRHAYLILDWENSALLVGQYWHPMFMIELCPSTLSFNSGVPFQPFSRNPQIKFTQKISSIYLSLTAASQLDFASYGPNGVSSSYLRNSVVPILNFTIKYVNPAMILGVSTTYMTLTPRIFSSDNYNADVPQKYSTNNSISGISAMVFAKFMVNEFTAKFEGVYGSNVSDLLMLGGYAVKSVNATTGAEEYTSTNTFSVWGDLSYGKVLELGIFAGYTKNLGTEENNIGTYYSRGSNIEDVFRVSPRIKYKMGNVKFGAEVEYTSAAYGTPNNNNQGKVENSISVANMRILLAAYLFF